MDMVDGTPCITTCNSISLHMNQTDAKEYIAKPPAAAPAPAPKRLNK